MRSNHIDLLHGSVMSSLSRLALPIMATSLIQTAYNLIDMVWIGYLGSPAVAAVGAAGMYIWLANGLGLLPKIGGQVNVAYSLGSGRIAEASKYFYHTFWLTIVIGVVYGLLCVALAKPFIGFFHLTDSDVISNAVMYLKITCGLSIFSFVNLTFSGIFTAVGNSKAAFIANTTGMVINIVLDPVLIFGVGPFPETGVMGAALATVSAQVVVTLMFLFFLRNEKEILSELHLRIIPEKGYIGKIIKIGLPVALQEMLFTGISMVISRMVAAYGDIAIAVQRVGAQIESISWSTSEGFSAAINTFIAQNKGAGNKKRIIKGYHCALGIAIIWGAFVTLLLVVFPQNIFGVFIHETELFPYGVAYLTIIGLSEIFMCVEITTSGAFSGLGKTTIPSAVGIIFTTARIPVAMLLAETVLGLNGIWWSISISSMLKGMILLFCFLYYQRKYLKNNGP